MRSLRGLPTARHSRSRGRFGFRSRTIARRSTCWAPTAGIRARSRRGSTEYRFPARLGPPTDGGSLSSATPTPRAASWSPISTAAASGCFGASPTTSRGPETTSGSRPGRRTARVLPTRSGGSTGATTSAPPYVMSADGGQPQLLARDAGDAAWSPGGHRIAFVSVRDRNGETCYDQCSYHGELYVMDADGTNAVRLTRDRGDETSPTWSPDGRRIAFASDRNYPGGAGQEIYSIRPDGSCLTWLTNGSPGSREPAWRDALGTSTDPGGCGATKRRPRVSVDLRRVRAVHDHPVFWLGKRYGDLLLSHAEAGRDVGLGYSDCASYHPRECPAPIQLQETSVCSRNTTLSVVAQPRYRPMRVFAERGLLFVDIGQGDLSVITGRAHVRIFPDARSRRGANRRALAAGVHPRARGRPGGPPPPPPP